MVAMIRRGAAQYQVALELGVTPATISNDYRAVMEELKESRHKDSEAIIAQQIAQHQEIIWENWRAWERSKEDAVRTVVNEEPERECAICSGSGKVRGKDKKSKPCFKCEGKGTLGGIVGTTTVREGRLPEVSYLRVIVDCMKEIAKLENLYPPEKREVSANVVNWDVFAQGIPEGPVDDVIEAEIVKALPAPKQEEQAFNDPIPSTNGVHHA